MNIETKLDFWKKKLLDLGKRNRQINSPYPKNGKRVSRISLLFEEPDSNILWNMLSEPGSCIGFSYEKIENVEDIYSIDEDKNPDEETESHEIKLDLEKNKVSEKFSNGIQTNQSVSDTIQTLISMMKKAREFSENKGLNSLYMSFGFLYWNENGDHGAQMRSPLLLVPVALSQESIADPVNLTRLDDDVVVNQSLVQKLKNEFGLILPEFQDNQSPEDYFRNVQDICNNFDWKVHTEEVQLSMYSFLKMAMYYDVEKNSEKILQNPIICALNGDLQKLDMQDYDPREIANFDHDSIKPSKVFSVLDADSSQQDAIMLAKKGLSFVLQGPPGTGKSQTITNMIAELIAEGKKVLFVSEKMAALQVVFHRLQQCGLGDFCLTLHDPNAKRKDILDQLNATMQLSKTKASLQNEAVNQLRELSETRDLLNQYAKDLHTTVEPLNKTIFEINGKLAKLVSYPNISYIQPDAGNFTEDKLFKCENILKELARIVKESGYHKENPWAGCQVHAITYEFRQAFLVTAETLTNILAEGEKLSENLFRKVGENNCRKSFSDLNDFLDFCRFSSKSPEIPPEWVGLELETPRQKSRICAELLAEKSKLLQFIKDFTQNSTALLNAASEFVKSADENAAEIPIEILSAFDNAHLNYTSIFAPFETDPLYEQENQFRKSADDCKEAESVYRQKTALCEEKEIEISKITETLETEQKILDEKQKNSEELKNIVLADFKEDILKIDVETLLLRYKNKYHSLFRFLSTQYHRDQKILKNLSVEKTKMPYAQAIDILEKVSAAQQAMQDTDKQAAYTAELLSAKNQKVQELSACRDEQKNALNILENAKRTLHDKLRDFSDECSKARHDYQKNASELDENIKINIAQLQGLLNIPLSENSDFETLLEKLDWTAEFQKAALKYEVQDDFIRSVCYAGLFTTQLNDDTEKLQLWLDHAKDKLPDFTDLFSDEYQEKFRKLSIKNLNSCIKNCMEQFSLLEYLIDYRNVKKAAEENSLDKFFSEMERLEIPHDKILPAFEKCFCRSWLDAVVPKFKSIETFRRKRQDEKIEAFQNLDECSMRIARASLKAKLISAMPNFDTIAENGNEAAILRREMTKKRKFKPLRKLIAEIPSLLPSLKPCILMSPLSVSTYFGDSDYEFDTVIFDEASQVRTEDAVCSIFRAKQVIIAGDSKQLPPTDFFSASVTESDFYEETEDGEADDTGAYESLLDEASILPVQTLLWHYRSKHEDLIAFSNLKIYDGKLVTFPSAVEKSSDMGVSYVYVEDGIYERTGRKGNLKEAQAIADMVFSHFKNHPERSIGIIAFGEAQQSMIENVINERRRNNIAFEEFFSPDRDEPFFIKNLETVQGDERDTIIFSIGYAKDASGKFIMNFGPLNRLGGERRLNVAVTRARYQLQLVGSIKPTDINTDRISSVGPKLLRDYIDFAIRGAGALIAENKENDTVWFDSPFEEAVYDFITANGYDVKTQVGCSGYRIDMAVRHPVYTGRFALGIECDGASYHSARTARERDRLRQTILENMGWKFYRIWSTDWIKDPDSEGKNLLAAISDAIRDYQEPEPAHKEIDDTDFLQISEKTENDSQEDISHLRSDYYGKNIKDIPLYDIEDTLLKITEHGFGYTKDGLFNDTIKFGYGWKRKGRSIMDKINRAYQNLLANQTLIEEDGKVKSARS